jgi:parvulin-like peptidyl-prolyl isomerase
VDETSAKKGGNLGYFIEENLIKELAKPVVEMQVGTVSEPIETSHGWHIVKLLAVREAVAPSFESIKDELRQQLIQEEIRKINAKITENAEIKILIKLQKPDSKLEKIDLRILCVTSRARNITGIFFALAKRIV